MGLYNDMESQIIGDIVRRIRNTGRLTETAELQAEALREQGYSPARILAEVRALLNKDPNYMAEVAQNTIEYKKMVSKIIKQTVNDAEIAGNYLVANAGMMSYRDDLRIWNDHGVNLRNGSALLQLIKAYTKQTNEYLRNLTQTTGAMELNGVKLQNAYRHELDLAIIKAVSGGFSFNKVLDDCCNNLARNGLKIVYPSGKKLSLESAARMCIKTGISQLSGKITEENIKKTGVKLVYVSAHAGSRPEHAKWQGKVYTYDGTPTAEYPDFVDSTDYGSVTGLKGVNCSHEFYPHWEGNKIPEFHEPDPIMFHNREYTYYQATQEQRKMECKARNLSHEIAAQNKIGNITKASELKKELSALNARYNTFSKSAGLRPKAERMEIYQRQNSNGNKTKRSTQGFEICTNMADKKITYNKPHKLKRKLTEEKIISRVGGKDHTDGCCTSQAMAYIGNKAGFDVLDYVGGESKNFFQDTNNIVFLACMPGVESYIFTNKNNLQAAKELLEMMEENKEYLLSTGEHTSIVKKENGEYLYLELQKHSKNNGYHQFGKKTLEKRFGCTNDNIDEDNILIDVGSLAKSEDFHEILGYINRRKHVL